ncbi:MAG: hypothetical protein RhofKO_06160 [Rhodothermales bacterium]
MAEYSILVVEDEHTLRRLLQYRLSKIYDVRTAANGVEALKLVEEHIPDLIISDIMMPRMDGFALQQALQKDQKTRVIPFIFLTAKADEQSRLRGMRTGVDDYITKPFDIEQLLSRVERLLERTSTFQNVLQDRIGQEFSQALMPKRMPEEDGYRARYHNTPREHGGGDLFDWTRVEDKGYLFTVGDVMGKGMKAKFYAFSFLGYIRSALHSMMASFNSPAELLTQINRLLVGDEMMEETFASLLLMYWEPDTHRITYANAGHCRPILVLPDETRIVEESDLILGLDPGAVYQDYSFDLPEQSAVLAFTDGLLEQDLKAGGMMGETGVQQVAQGRLGVTNPIDSILRDTLARSSSPTFTDDILVFWLERQR